MLLGKLIVSLSFINVHIYPAFDSFGLQDPEKTGKCCRCFELSNMGGGKGGGGVEYKRKQIRTGFNLNLWCSLAWYGRHIGILCEPLFFPATSGCLCKISQTRLEYFSFFIYFGAYMYFKFYGCYTPDRVPYWIP